VPAELRKPERAEQGRKVPVIGKKATERLLLELKGKLADVLPQADGVQSRD